MNTSCFFEDCGIKICVNGQKMTIEAGIADFGNMLNVLFTFEEHTDDDGDTYTEKKRNTDDERVRHIWSEPVRDSITTLEFKGYIGLSDLDKFELYKEFPYLEEIIFPMGLKKIPASSCEYMKKLKRVHIPNSVVEIGAYAFRRCESLTSVTIPDGVSKIGFRAFSECTSLAEVNLSEGLQEIGSLAFEDCKSLKKIALPKSAKKIDEDAFDGCPAKPFKLSSLSPRVKTILAAVILFIVVALLGMCSE